MIKKSFLPILLIILVSIYAMVGHLNLYPPENILIKTFSNSGATLVNWEIYLSGEIDNSKFDSVEKLEILTEEIFRDLNIKKNNIYSNNKLSNDIIYLVDIEGFIKNDRTIVNLKLSKDKKSPTEKHISISIINDEKSLNLQEIKEDLESVFKKYGIKTKINICITGFFEGKLEKDQVELVCRNMLLEANAKKIEGLEAKNMISISAYSPEIRNSIQTANKKVNLNLAVRYNSYEDRTYIWIASPIIERSY